MELQLAERAAVVTGGGTGIGRAIALALADAGARIAVCGRRLGPLDETAEAVRAAGGTCAVLALDVRDAAAVARTFADAAKILGRIDILVNNAGVGGPNACAQGGDDRWDEIVRTNLDGVFFCSREALRHMSDGGRIINISSVLGRFGVPGYTAYCASKHGVLGFTKALALEVATRRITVNAVCPGWVETEMAREGMERIAKAEGISQAAARRQALDQVPIQRIIAPEEVAQLVVYIASPAAAAMTAQAVSLCGGSTMV